MYSQQPSGAAAAAAASAVSRPHHHTGVRAASSASARLQEVRMALRANQSPYTTASSSAYSSSTTTPPPPTTQVTFTAGGAAGTADPPQQTQDSQAAAASSLANPYASLSMDGNATLEECIARMFSEDMDEGPIAFPDFEYCQTHKKVSFVYYTSDIAYKEVFDKECTKCPLKQSVLDIQQQRFFQSEDSSVLKCKEALLRCEEEYKLAAKRNPLQMKEEEQKPEDAMHYGNLWRDYIRAAYNLGCKRRRLIIQANFTKSAEAVNAANDPELVTLLKDFHRMIIRRAGTSFLTPAKYSIFKQFCPLHKGKGDLVPISGSHMYDVCGICLVTQPFVPKVTDRPAVDLRTLGL